MRAAVEAVPRLFMTTTFWTEGESGATMDTVQQPAVIAAGMRIRERSSFWKSCRQMGYMTK